MFLVIAAINIWISYGSCCFVYKKKTYRYDSNKLLLFFSCSSRYVGEFCQYPNPCHTGPGPRCQNGGTCTVSFKDGTPVFTCACPIGFTASLCEIHEKNACDSSPCQHGGTCNLKTLEQYTCLCAQGYTGENY